jgi:hypothetical protein
MLKITVQSFVYTTPPLPLSPCGVSCLLYPTSRYGRILVRLPGQGKIFPLGILKASFNCFLFCQFERNKNAKTWVLYRLLLKLNKNRDTSCWEWWLQLITLHFIIRGQMVFNFVHELRIRIRIRIFIFLSLTIYNHLYFAKMTLACRYS